MISECLFTRRWNSLLRNAKFYILGIQISRFIIRWKTTIEKLLNLGIIITDNLKPAKNCQVAHSKANHMLYMFRRMIIYRYQDIVLPHYKTLVEYCTPAWSPHYNKDKVLLEKMQHKFTGMVPGLSKMDYGSRSINFI